MTPTPTESQPDKGKDVQETTAAREEPEQQLLDTTAGNNAAAIAGNGATPGEVPVTPTESQPDKGKDGKGADAPAAATPTDVMGHNAGAPADGSGISAVASATDQNATAPTDHLAVSAELAKGAPPETGDIEVAKGAGAVHQEPVPATETPEDPNGKTDVSEATMTGGATPASTAEALSQAASSKRVAETVEIPDGDAVEDDDVSVVSPAGKRPRIRLQ